MCAASFCLPNQPALVSPRSHRTLTSCQDLYLPRVSSQSPLVGPPKCHFLPSREERGVTTLPLLTVKEAFVSPLCPRLLRPALKGAEASWTAFLSQGSPLTIGQEKNPRGCHPLPHPYPWSRDIWGLRPDHTVYVCSDFHPKPCGSSDSDS